MIPVCQNKISIHSARTGFTLQWNGGIKWRNQMGESNFMSARRDSFQPGICLDLFTFLLIFLCKHVINYFFIPLRRTKAIAWENFVLAVQKRDPALPRWNFPHIIVGYNLWRVYSTIGIPVYETESHPGQPGSWNHRLKQIWNRKICTYLRRRVEMMYWRFHITIAFTFFTFQWQIGQTWR